MKLYLILFIIAIIPYSLRSITSKQGVFGDGNAYWSYAHTLTFQGNLDFTDIYNHLNNFEGKKYAFTRAFWRQEPTLTGMLPNQWLIGPAILWLPALVVVNTFTTLFQIPISPFSLFWEFVAGVSGITYGLLGLFILEKTLNKYFSKKISTITITTLFLTTHLFFYIAFEPLLSHSNIFFLNSLLLYVITHLSAHKYKTWLSLGIIFGLISITRPSGISIFPLLIYLAHQHSTQKKRTKRTIISFCTGLFIGILPQLLVQQILFGSPFSQPYMTGYHGSPSFSPSHILPALFSAKRGLFIWTPILFSATLSLAKWSKKNDLGKFFLLFLVIHLLIVGTWNGVLSAGFGNRFFIEVLPVLAFGLAHFFSSKSPKQIVVITLLSLYWNLALLTQFFLDKPRLVDQQNLTYINLVTGQLTFPAKLLSALTNPGSIHNLLYSILD